MRAAEVLLTVTVNPSDDPFSDINAGVTEHVMGPRDLAQLSETTPVKPLRVET